MIDVETLRPTHRAALVVVLVLILAGTFVWYGTVGPDPADNNYPGNVEISQDPDAYLGEHVSVGGTVVAHDPLCIEVGHGLDGTRPSRSPASTIRPQSDIH